MAKEKDIKKIATERLLREINKRHKRPMDSAYLRGYHTAICDILYDYDGTLFASMDWEKYQKELLEKGIIKKESVKLDKVKK